MKYSYDGYLTQQKLKVLLSDIYGENLVQNEVRVPNTRMKWDFFIVNNNNKETIIEFDGDQHYRDSLVIQRDNRKDIIAKELGYDIIRIPYFIQLTSQMFYYYFNYKLEIETNFGHGYIKSNVFPASYCQLGIVRYKKELLDIPNNVNNDIKKTLISKSEKYGSDYVNIF